MTGSSGAVVATKGARHLVATPNENFKIKPKRETCTIIKDKCME